MTKQKSPRQIFERTIIYCFVKYNRRQCTLLPPPGSSHLENLTQKRKILNVFWIYPVSKEKIDQLNFFSWISNLKNLVISYGSIKRAKCDPNGINSATFQKYFKKSPCR